MDKQRREESIETQQQWIPQTPMKPNSPIYPNPTETEPNLNQTEERCYKKDMNGYLDHLSFGDLLALANSASSFYFSGPKRRVVIEEEKMMPKGCDETLESLGSVSNNNNVDEHFKTPDKPKRRKHRPKVVREVKPKADPKPRTPRKPVLEGQESKTPRRKRVAPNKKEEEEEAVKNQESTTSPVQESASVEASTLAKKLCRRALDFEEEPENGEKQADTEKQESEDCVIISAPSTPKRDRRQSKRKEKEDENGNGVKPARRRRRRQGKEEPSYKINLPGIHYDDQIREYQNTQWLYFTNEQQESMRSDATSSTSFAGQRLNKQDDLSFTSQTSKDTFQEIQIYEPNVKVNKISTPVKKKTTGHARYRKMSSVNKVAENNVHVETRVTLSKKKRITKSVKPQTSQITILPNLHQLPASFTGGGLSPDELWNRLYSMEAISESLRLLDINREYSETALIPYHTNGLGNKIILFGGEAGKIVPFTPVKKRRARAKVDLDNETEKVWKLLLENINNEGIDGSDEQKEKWWENERSVFKGRADSFIARMHLVQGDRRFTPWKGSVVDSVVGVFLTQNVSDHLSRFIHKLHVKLNQRPHRKKQTFANFFCFLCSSAFMSLAAEFPAPSVPCNNFDVGTCSLASIRITYLDSEESINTTQPDEGKEDYVNNNDTSLSSSEIASSAAPEPFVKATASKAHVVDLDRKGLSEEVDHTCLVQYPLPSEDSAITCQHSLFPEASQSKERAGSSSEINSKGEHYDSYVKLLQSLGSPQLQSKGSDNIAAHTVSVEKLSSNPGSSQVSPNTSPGDCSSSLQGPTKSSDDSNEPCCSFQQGLVVLSCQKPEMPESSSSVPSTKHKEKLVTENSVPDINESTSCLHVEKGKENPQEHDSEQRQASSYKENKPTGKATLDVKGKKALKEEKERFDWDSLRREAQGREGIKEKTSRTMDSVDWEAIRTAHVSEVAETIKSRGMNHKLAERIQGFLNRLLTEHGSIDLEWLRDAPPDKAKEYLLSFRGLGLKSVECVRLLTLHHLAFPVDTNVGRIAVRLGWVPLQPLPESLQLHLLEMYPVLESIQKYLWPRLCKLDQKTLYELHYQMITFGKVFCTKSKPNCNACPMRGECRHFASAFASARLALPGTEKAKETPDNNPLPLHLPEPLRREGRLEVVIHPKPSKKVECCEPIIEEPASPEPQREQVTIADIEDAFYEDPEEIPTIRLNMDAFTSNLKKIMEHSKELQDGNMSSALVALTAEPASLPMPKLKNISQLRTEHQVYELPDSHPLLAEMEKRELDDPCSYLLAIWTPGETVDSVQPSVSKCISRDAGKLCDEETCFSCNSIKEARSHTVRGTILIPCRTAMRGSFPLNGTYFQVNEVFADHDSSLTPIDVPREWLWDLTRRTVYFGTSIPSIFKGLSTETIQQCFWRGYVCVRGFDRKTRGPKPLIARLHFPVSKMRSQANQPNQGAL
ncbi:unnamed protein product [Cochlearia groenlandica]